ncbi:MAG: type I CRISPR-associated protein Cas8a1/Csx8 [Fusobacteriaceae bacterium]|nr:type I CRISPR-associated protein Cas8a1/Csx8 [Fusobacteriaceae bacterium]
MLTELENGIIRIEPSDWRWGASIVGFIKYVEYHKETEKIEIDDEFIKFNMNLITEDKYLEFAENIFADKMHHKIVEDLLTQEATPENIKAVNDKLSQNTSSNTIMIKTFKGIKYDEENRELIETIIEKNRNELILNTFRGGRSLYYKFCNENNMLKGKGSSCRLRGYSVDMGKKGKSVSFMANSSTFVFEDHPIFDFIPFAFSKTRESFFINNNFTIGQLVKSNKFEPFEDENAFKSKLFFKVKNSSDYIDYDVEIITKDMEKEYYESLYLRKNAIKTFENISETTVNIISSSCKLERFRGNVLGESVNNDGYINIQSIVVNSVINNIKLDDLIDVLLKEKTKQYLISQLIIINLGGKMTEEQKKALASALAIKKKLLAENKGNKLRSYEQRFISAITLKDYDKVKELLLHLSAYTQLRIDFAMELFEDFEGNKDLAYTFINGLGEKTMIKNETENKGGQN